MSAPTATLPTNFTTRCATPDDLDLVTALIRECEFANTGLAEVEAEDIAGDWRRPNFDLSRDSLFVFDEDMNAAAYAEVFASRAEVEVLPQHRNKGIGIFLADWVAIRGAQQGGTGIRQVVSEKRTDAIELLEHAGYKSSDTGWVLNIEIADVADDNAVLPTGYTIRNFVPGVDDEKIWQVIEDSFSPWDNRPPTTVESWRALTIDRSDFRADLFPIVEFNGEIVGGAYCIDYPNDDNGWVQQVAVHEDHRSKGLGSALLRHVFVRFRDAGRSRIGLSTDSRTGALDLYLRIGMQVTREFRGFFLKY